MCSINKEAANRKKAIKYDTPNEIKLYRFLFEVLKILSTQMRTC